MKNIIILCSILSLSGCLKIQKKTDLDKPNVQPTQQIPEPASAPVVTEAKPDPVIIVLDSTLSLDQNTEIVADEIYLKSNAKIYTNQFSINIKATSIFIERGVLIQSFAENNSVAPLETPGLSGGTVQIVANDIHGHLQVIMNGQIGGVGFGGWNAFPATDYTPDWPACAPRGGKNSGQSGSFFLEVHNSQDFYVSTFMQLAPGGAIGPISDLLSIQGPLVKFYNNFKRDDCNAVPTIGKPGWPGQICMKLSQTDRPQCERF